MVNNAAEAVGYALIVAFLYLLWAPLALLGAGLLLVVWANVRATHAKGSGRTMAAVGAAWAAARHAYRQTATTAELRRVV